MRNEQHRHLPFQCLLVDIFSPEDITRRVIDVLVDRRAYATIALNGRRTIVENYDLRGICLPAQLRLMNMAARGML